MRILLITATELEMKALDELPASIECQVTGVGVPSTLYQLQKILNNQSFDLVIQAGIAGSFNRGRSLGEVVKVASDYFADLGIREKNILSPLYDSVLADKTGRFYPDGLLANNGDQYSKVELPAVKGITVNLVSDDIEYNNLIRNTFSPEVESMEGAALHYVCLREAVDFIQLRAISNMVGERDKALWEVDIAFENLRRELKRMLAIFC